MGISKDRRTISGAEYRCVSMPWTQSTAGAAKDVVMMVAPAKAVIEQCIIVSDTATTASVAITHYTMQIRNLTQSENLLATAASVVGADWVADTPYTLTPDQNQIVSQDDVIEFQIGAVGTPTDLRTAIITLQCNYRPI